MSSPPRRRGGATRRLHARVDERVARVETLRAFNQWLLEACIELEARQHAASVRLGLDPARPARKLPALTAVAAAVGVLFSGLATLFAYVAWLDTIESMHAPACSCSNLEMVFSGLGIAATVGALLTLVASRRPGAGGRGRILLRRVTMGACAAAGLSLIALLALT